MEHSESEVEAQKSFHSPPRRRRSTFFEKRESIVPQLATENIDPNMCNKENEVDEKHNKELKRYYDLLLAEKNKWKEEVKSRQNKYHDLRQSGQVIMKASTPRSYIVQNSIGRMYRRNRRHLKKCEPEHHDCSEPLPQTGLSSSGASTNSSPENRSDVKDEKDAGDVTDKHPSPPMTRS